MNHTSARKRPQLDMIAPDRTVNGSCRSDITSHQPVATRQRQRLSVFLPAPLLDRLRNAVYWTRQRPLAQIIADAIEDAVAEMEHANGAAFPPRLAPLKAGRPRGSRVTAPAHVPHSSP